MKDNFDDILKRKMEQQHFAVDDNHRQQMAELLNDSKRKRPFPFWWLGALVVVAAVAGFYFLNSDNEAGEPLDLNNSMNTEIKPSNTKVEMAHANDLTETENTITQSVQSDDNSTVLKAEVIRNAQNEIGLNQNDFKKSNPLNESITGSDTALSTLAGVAKGKNQTGNIDQTTSLEIVSLNTEVDDDKADLISQRNSEDLFVQDESEEVVFEDAEVYYEIFDARNVQAAEPIDALALTGVIAPTGSKIKQITPMTTFKKSLFVFGEAVMGLVFGSQPHYDTGWKLRAGLGLGYRLSPKVQASLTAGYLYQNGGFDFQRISAVDQPGFGSRSTFNSLTPEKLHFVYTKLGIQVRTRRHIFATHGGLQYLYGAQGTISMQVVDQFAPGTIEVNSYSWVKTDGLRKLNWSLDLSYGYQITPRLSVTAGADYYFSSFTIDDPSLEAEGYTWNGAYSPFQPFVNINYLLYGRL